MGTCTRGNGRIMSTMAWGDSLISTLRTSYRDTGARAVSFVEVGRLIDMKGNGILVDAEKVHTKGKTGLSILAVGTTTRNTELGF